MAVNPKMLTRIKYYVKAQNTSALKCFIAI